MFLIKTLLIPDGVCSTKITVAEQTTEIQIQIEHNIIKIPPLPEGKRKFAICKRGQGFKPGAGAHNSAFSRTDLF